MEEMKKKRKYVKPMMIIQPYADDNAGAYNCMADGSVMQDLIDLGYFTAEMNCQITSDAVRAAATTDPICYHTNVIAAFNS